MVSTRRIHFGWFSFVAICFVAVVVAAVMMYIAWDHNPQLAFHEDGMIHWGAWLTIGVAWFVAIAGIPSIIVLTAITFSFFRRRQ
jgi:heme/copper-type cytochrome/quinol oxidase subunit 2